MQDSTLTAICEAKSQNALGWSGSALSKERVKAMQYYYGEPFGNEQEGRSQVVSRDVAEAIDQAMPSLLKPFVATDTIVVFNPRTPEDEAIARQVTDYINYVWQNLPNAFDLLETWVKDGLLAKLGVVKSWWDTKDEVTTERYHGLTAIQYQALLADENVEPGEFTTSPAPPSNGPLMPGDDGMLYDCEIKRTNTTGFVNVMAVPPEEFLTERRAVSLPTAAYCAHRSLRTPTDLIEEGYDKTLVNSLAGGDDENFDADAIERFRQEDEQPQRGADNLDQSMRPIWTLENFLKVDYDGDGVAEWRRVVMAGSGGYELLGNDTCDGHPFAAWTPYKMPHKLYGESMADKVHDVQLIKSTVWRQTMDGMYFNNAPQLTVVEGQANMADVLTRRPGGVIRQKAPGMVMPLPTNDMTQSGFSMLSYLDGVKETRTGIRRFTSGLQEDALNPYANTATGINKVDESSQDAMELIARNFAEQGLVPLFKRMLELICKHQNKALTVKLRGEWVNINPSEWHTNLDLVCTVGLGSGNQQNKVAQLMGMMTQINVPLVQAQGGLDGPIYTWENLYRQLTKLTESMGFKTKDGFYNNPANAPPKPPEATPPDPKMIKVQADIAAQQAGFKLKQEQAVADHKLKSEQAYANLMLQAETADKQSRTDAMLAIQKMEREHELRLLEMNDEQEARIAEMMLEARLGAMQIAADAKVKGDANRMNGAAQIRRPS